MGGILVSAMLVFGLAELTSESTGSQHCAAWLSSRDDGDDSLVLYRVVANARHWRFVEQVTSEMWGVVFEDAMA
jgi:hypothetical protein